MGRDDNKDVVLSFLRAAQAGDHETALSLVAEDVVVYPPRPTNEGPWVGRDHMRGRQPRHIGLYQSGTVQMEVERVVCDGDYVAVQFVLRALTARGEPYENFYFFLFECRDGLIVAFWEYVDTLYAEQTVAASKVDHGP